METLLGKFENYVAEHNICSHGDRILLAVSGGVDSMVMLSLFAQSGYRIGVAHCNFQLRGPEAEEDEQLVADAIKYVEANIGRSDLSVEELSRELGMSRVHLYKKLSQITGKTPIEFIRIIRLKRAAQLLRESQRNVSEIAYQLGFNNPKYFSKYFRDEFGVLPSVYQEREGK